MDVLLTYVLPFVGMLVALIVIHEFGHYLTAKMFGIKVLEAGIGYPPRAWGFTWHGTIYSINWLPLGGFVRLLGEEDPTDPQSLAAQKAWKRIIVLASGSWMNLALPVLLFAAFFMIPHDISRGPVEITSIVPDSPAATAEIRADSELLDTRGLQVGDRLLKVNGETVKNTADAGREIRLHMGQTVTFTIERRSFGESETLEARLKARWREAPTGISIRNVVSGSAVCQGTQRSDECVETEQYGLLSALEKGWTSTWDSLVLARNQFLMVVHGGEGPKVAGPAGLGQATGEIVDEAGWQPLLEFAALLSLNLAIINMLPLPMLDGGRVVFVLIEVARRGKRIAPEKEAIVHLIGLALIITMAVVVTYMDVARIIGGRSLFE